jgi:hypothetical protein
MRVFNPPNKQGDPEFSSGFYSRIHASTLASAGAFFWSFPAPLEMSGTAVEPALKLSGIVWNRRGVV